MADNSPSATPQYEQINWKRFARQSFFLGIQHGFRLATEPGSRSGRSGPFGKGYCCSLSNLHGWADQEQLDVNYLGHAIQGTVSGFIWVQNDDKYGKVEYGNNA